MMLQKEHCHPLTRTVNRAFLNHEPTGFVFETSVLILRKSSCLVGPYGSTDPRSRMMELSVSKRSCVSMCQYELVL